jgi:hypothetical protein
MRATVEVGYEGGSRLSRQTRGKQWRQNTKVRADRQRHFRKVRSEAVQRDG